MTEQHEKRMERFLKAGLYLVTSQSMSSGRKTADIVAASLKAGVRLIQLREKDMPVREFFELSLKVRKLTTEAGALLLINDRLDIAMASGADGVHLGQDDFPIGEARKLAPDMIIGASSHSKEEAVAAEKAGASYVNIGPLFPTGTKKWTGEYLGVDAVPRISKGLRIPFTVMGGIKKEHISGLLSAGARTMAVVTAVTAAPDPEYAARELLAMISA
jgi:thiamine-phosphate pyrophosphorylase